MANEEGYCRESKPEFELPPPNEGFPFLDQLVFGRRSYDAELQAWYQEKLSRGNNVPDWRTKLEPRDDWALKPIVFDPIGDLQKTPQPYLLWDALKFYEEIQTYPPFVDALLDRVRAKNFESDVLYRKMTSTLRTFFETIFLRHGRPCGGPGSNPKFFHWPSDDQHNYRAKKSFNVAVTLIARWFIVDYFQNISTWSQAAALYASLGPEWRKALEDRKGRPASRIQFTTEELPHVGRQAESTGPTTGIQFEV